MAVQTPQLNVPVYQPKDMAQAPALETPTAQALPPQAGFVSKAGAASYVASNILNGWLKGREHAQQQALAKAQNQVQGANYTYSVVAQHYNDLLKQGKKDTDPDVQKAKQAAVEAWNNNLNVMQRYSGADSYQKPKGAKAKTQNWLGQHFGRAGITPELLPKASLALLRSQPPPGLGLTAEDQQSMTQQQLATAQLGRERVATEADQLKLDQTKAQQAQDKQVEDIVRIPEDQRTLKQKDDLSAWQRVQHINDPQEKQLADAILTKIKNGQPLNDTERNFAYSQRLISAPQQVVHTDAKGNDQILMISPDGKVLSTANLGHHYEPDQVGPAIRLANAQQQATYQLYNQAAPRIEGETADARQQRIWGMVAADYTRNPNNVSTFLTDNPQQKEQDLDRVNKALRTVWAQAGGPGADTATRQASREALSNFVLPGTSDDPSNAGLFVFRDQVADPTGKKGYWFGSKESQYAGGIVGQQKLATEQAALANQVRAVLLSQNKNLTPTDLDRLVPPWLSGRGQQSLSPTPGSSTGGPQSMQPTPGGVQTFGTSGGNNRRYRVIANGVTSEGYMTPDDAKSYKDNYPETQVTEIQ